jgi:hypothetical protein
MNVNKGGCKQHSRGKREREIMSFDDLVLVEEYFPAS